MPGNRRKKGKTFLIRFYAIALLVVVFDQLTKYAALAALSEGQSIPVIAGVFHFTLVHNTGIAFGLFQGYQLPLLVIITLSIGLLIAFSSGASDGRAGARWSLALVLGGAVGNWIDRLRHEAVIDFLDFRIWPVFNLADCAITVGVGLYILLFFLEKSKTSPDAFSKDNDRGNSAHS